MPGSVARVAASRGNAPPMLGDNVVRRRMQVMRPPVIAETAPVFEHARERRRGKGIHVGELGEQALVVRDDRRDLRLLQHDLGQPDAVRDRACSATAGHGGRARAARRRRVRRNARASRAPAHVFAFSARKAAAAPCPPRPTADTSRRDRRASGGRRPYRPAPTATVAMLSSASGTFWLSGYVVDRAGAARRSRRGSRAAHNGRCRSSTAPTARAGFSDTSSTNVAKAPIAPP